MSHPVHEFGASNVQTTTVKNLLMQKMQEMWLLSLDLEDPLEEGMATHFNILAWKIPWT